MIKTIIKRNGTKVPFDAAKLNGWGLWAAKKLGTQVNWQEVLLSTISTLPEEVSSQVLQESLISYCISKNTWEYSRMAGRLYAALLPKIMYGSSHHPTVKDLHDKLHAVGLMVKLNYSDEEYEQVEKIIDHTQDFKCAHFEIHQLRFKYALRDKILNLEYETPQFIYMRMAMALAEDEKTDRMLHLAKWYEHLSAKRINAPTPYMTNLGTGHDGYASCCVYTTDDTAPSLAAGDHIAYMMTVMSAGIGTHIKTRSLGDKIRGGLIPHQGKIPYYKALVGAIGANLQNGRGGAATVHYTAYDPEAKVIAKLKNPMTPASKQVRGCDYSFGSNKFFARKVARKENFAPFSYQSNPELYEAQYLKDQTVFENLYKKHIKTNPETESARDLLVTALTEGFETGRHYLHQTDTLNHHTPFKEKIYSSNLCQEIALPTKSFKNVADLYRNYKEGDGEIATCNIAGVIVSNIESDEQYAEVAYYTLKMIDVGIHKTRYVFPALRDTATSRLNAGVGVLGLAHLMAKHHKKYSDQDGRNFIHQQFETHAWHLYNASLRLAKELGNAPWMHKTRFPEGWLPIDTYEKRVDSLVTIGNLRDWELLRSQIIANKGIRNSVVSAHMPGESSTIAAGTTNGVYPIRDFDLNKTNETLVVNWVAPDSTKLRQYYELAYEIETDRMIDNYAIEQKWTDQAISADLYRKLQGTEKVGTSEMIDTYLNMVKGGLKSRYYQNTLTAKGIKLTNDEEETSDIPSVEEESSDVGCASGTCSL